jgi:Flp pilus assembly protein TadG
MNWATITRRLPLIRECDGAAAAEFAMIFPLLLLLVLGIYEFGKIYWINNTLQFAAEQTARCILANETSTSSDSITSVTTAPCNANSYILNLSTANGTPSTSLVSSCHAIDNGTYTANTYCRSVTIDYSLSSTGDPIWGLVWNLIRVVTRQSASASTFTLRGYAVVPIGYLPTSALSCDNGHVYPAC